ncbi:MAG: translocation/assembly module TamB domain-containing protein [Muribaculaceae bacterium]|nr:translocation/assembly module TamB domain-containing protein [Muribaculaceae bacterium]
MSVLLLLAVLLPSSVYVLLSLNPVQEKIRSIAAGELSKTLGADLSIGRVIIHPFNRLSISDVSLALENDTVASVSNVSAGFELYHFLRTGELVIDYALVDGARFHVCRDSVGAPLNIQPLIDHLRSDKPKREKAFELKINTVILRNGSLSYDINSAALPDSGRFCPSHIAVENLAVNAFIPRISNSRYQVHIDHISFDERSGFALKALQGKADFGADGARLYDFSLDLPESHIALKPIEIEFNGFNDIKAALRRDIVSVSTSGDNYIYPPDFKAFVPMLADISRHFDIDLDARGNMTSVDLRSFALRDADGTSLSLAATGLARSIDDKSELNYDLTGATILIDGRQVSSLLRNTLKKKPYDIIRSIEDLHCSVTASGTLESGSVRFSADGTPGIADFEGSYRRYGRSTALDGALTAEGVDLNLLTGVDMLGKLSATVDGKATVGPKPAADIALKVSQLDFHGHTFSDISAEAVIDGRERAELDISVNDSAAKLLAYAFYDKNDDTHTVRATAVASDIDLNTLGFDKRHPGYRLGAKLNVALGGTSVDDVAGTAQIFDIRWLDESRNGLRVNKMDITLNPDDNPASITVDSDFLKGSVTGKYAFTSIAGQLRSMAGVFVPALFDDGLPTLASAKRVTSRKKKHEPEPLPNVFNFDFTVLPSQSITSFLGLPVHVLYDVDITGNVDSERGLANVNISAPYLQQGNKLVEHTDIFAHLDTLQRESSVYLTTQFPTKKGDLAVASLIKAENNRFDTHIDWTIERAIPLNGTIGFSTLLRSRPGKKEGETFPLDAHIVFNPGTVNFGDEVWKILRSHIDIAPERLAVSGFGLDAGTQSIAVNGVVSASDTDSLAIALRQVALLPIFETLEIDKALIGGRATGTFTARNLLGSEPELVCPRLHVDSIGYQRCTIGDADILAGWNNSARSFYLDADITGLEGRKSHIVGDIFPLSEALDIKFAADSVPVGFLKPFMSAFTSDISGRASGNCRLFGTFKEIDLEGDIMADNVKLKIDFTGTSYIATDSIHIRPGRIALDNITIRDTEGHTARLNGLVEHKFFKEPTFRFDITNAYNLLSYNVTARDNPDWYGTIYGNGGASISGYPGVVSINVAMSTAPRSNFTFVLSDRLDAEDYSFITFRDVTPDSLKVAEVEIDDTPEAVKEFKRRADIAVDEPSQYNMDIRVDVTKDADMTLVMDPAGGDAIKAHGDGNLHLAYRSANNDLNIWGKYVLTDGSYRFTLQDIIIKDFTIKEGSEIQFDGDPYGVKTKLQAYYATNANLSDLDESFLQDKEVARTNVPVHALMNVSGDIRQPSIDFDLEFPTLTQDTYRKVRSIVSTSDMMNRQIIYLLALNRFYTPDYMASTTKGSELFSVASSTISSQLGNMLGKLSDNWSIAPNLRSDRGDFSDVEVDVALSSRLLNNRLIFNGNFGYRDKTLNSNQFIGDFDIEYLLNKRGSWRLKAYNRYNDRNYYLRSAQTTQGLGIMFRRDFDSFLSFLRRKKKKE